MNKQVDRQIVNGVSGLGCGAGMPNPDGVLRFTGLRSTGLRFTGAGGFRHQFAI